MRSILIVDDEEGIRDILAAFLKESGYRVHAVDNGREALDFLENFRDIDLIVSDIRMPVMGGNALAKHVRSMSPDLAIIGITGSNWDFDPGLFDMILEKPFRLKVLADAIEQVLGQMRN